MIGALFFRNTAIWTSAAMLLMIAAFAHADTIAPGLWYEFSFTDVGVQARGCFPEDPDPSALDCLPSSAGNSVFAPAPPWTFTSTARLRFVVTDAFLHGDSFDIFDEGVPIFSTPAVATDGNGCGDNPVVCLKDPLSSHASFLLSPGAHSITIFPDAIGDAGAAYFQIVPEPAMLTMLCLALAGRCLIRLIAR